MLLSFLERPSQMQQTAGLKLRAICVVQAELGEANSKLSAAETRALQVKNAGDSTKSRLDKELKETRAAVVNLRGTVSTLNKEIEVCPMICRCTFGGLWVLHSKTV